MRHILLLGLSALPLAAHADATDLMAIVNPALADSRPTFRISASGFAADDFVPAHRIADPWRDAPDPRPGRNLAIGFGLALLLGVLFAFFLGFAIMLGAELNNAIQEEFPAPDTHADQLRSWLESRNDGPDNETAESEPQGVSPS